MACYHLCQSSPATEAATDTRALLRQAFPAADVSLSARNAAVRILLRAGHRSLTLRALLAKKREQSGIRGRAQTCETLLAQARLVRRQAQALVQQQEANYRYPLADIARRHPGLTAYPFGYLYPVSCLYFWEREEQQVRQGRFDALFMNLWDIWRTLGLASLF